MTTIPQPVKRPPERFKILAFTNPRTDSQSWRVAGIKRDGTRVRENFQTVEGAQCRQVELQTEWLARQTDTAIRATKLSDAQIRLAESAFMRLDADAELLLAVDHWLKHGRQLAVAESPRLDDAFNQYKLWLEKECPRRAESKKNLRIRALMFVNSMPNSRMSEITPDAIEDYLAARDVSPVTRDNDRRGVSRFMSWCMDRKRRWISVNPCSAVRIDKGEKGPPAILTLKECRTLLRAADKFKGGKLAPFVAVALFAGLRPFELKRLAWAQINLQDREIRLEGTQTKTGKPRVVDICDTLAAWLLAHKDKPFFPKNWRRDFDTLRAKIGYGRATVKQPHLKPWIDDIMRHTAISHYFRETGSYGRTAEQFGNSEPIIKRDYQGRVASEETTAFFSIIPAKV